MLWFPVNILIINLPDSIDADSNGFETSFWTDKFHNDTDKTIDNSDKNTEKGREMVISGLFLIGEISMLGFSLEEDECVVPKSTKDIRNYLPTYTVSEISKSFKITLPKKIVLFTQMLMSPYLPVSDGRESLSFSQSSSNIDKLDEITENNGKECTSVIRAHAFVTMGKFCLREKNMARSHVNVFLRELHCKSTSSQ